MPKPEDEAVDAIAELRTAVEKANALMERLAEFHERMSALIARLEKVAAKPQELKGRDQSGSSQGVVTTSKRVRVSLRAVAEAVGVSHVLLSQARSGKRRIRRKLAENIAAITPDLPATRKTWPAGWVPED